MRFSHTPCVFLYLDLTPYICEIRIYSFQKTVSSLFTSDYVISLFKDWGQTRWVPEPSTVKALDDYLITFREEDFVGEHHLKVMLTYFVNSRLQINKDFY